MDFFEFCSVCIINYFVNHRKQSQKIFKMKTSKSFIMSIVSGIKIHFLN